mmetsp:Transcript_102280/g.327947  ORF Transcript_102280/g.327947 Transcript_102280/m.327947 type:complete len:241 (+) Transcript_102280:43-765(+)
MVFNLHNAVVAGKKLDKNHVFDKTKLCKFFPDGLCKRGQVCTFAHSGGEVLPRPDFFKTQLCPAVQKGGACTFEAGCHYAHDPAELRSAVKNQRARGGGSGQAAQTPPHAWSSTSSDKHDEAENDEQAIRSHTSQLLHCSELLDSPKGDMEGNAGLFQGRYDSSQFSTQHSGGSSSSAGVTVISYSGVSEASCEVSQHPNSAAAVGQDSAQERSIVDIEALLHQLQRGGEGVCIVGRLSM